MSKRFYFFKKVVQGGLGNDTFFTLWELVESWTSQNNWMAIFFIIFLGIIFEIILLKICTSFQKKPALPSEKDKSEVHKKEDNESCLKSMKFDNWSALSSSEARVDDFSERTIASSITSERNEEYFEDSIPPPDEPPRASTSESRFRVSHFSESHMTSSNGTSSSSLSLFHSEVQEILLSCSGCPKNEHETIQFSSKKLFSIMKSNKNKNRTFSSDFNFSRTSRIIIESEDIDVAPCPPAHLFLTRDQVRLLEENVRNQSPSKSKATLENKITSLCSISLEPLIQNQHSATMDISPQAQASFSRQKAPQSQGFSKAQFTGEAHQLFNSQASVSRQPEREARHSAPPRDLPLSSSTQDAFQTLDTDRSQRLVQVPQSAETQESVKGLGPDTKHSDEAQDSVWSEDSNKIKYSTPGQDTVLKDARHLVLPPSPTSVAKVMPQLEHVKTEGQKQIAFSTLNQSPAYGSLPLMTRQKNRRERSRSKSELSLKDPPQKSKKTPASQVFQTTACHTAECRQLRYEHKTKKIELHQRKGVSGIALHFTYAFKLVPPYIRKYSRKRQAKFTPGLTECKDFLSKPDQSLCAEKVNYVGSVEEKGTTGSTESEEQHGRNNKELENISQEVPSQLEQSFMVNTYPQKVPCPPLIETNWTNKESLEDPKEMDMAESCAPNSKTTSDLPVARQETPLEEAISEPLKKVSSPQMKSDRNMKTWEDLQGTEDSNPDLSSREELPTSVSEMQRCVSQGNTDRKDLEIVLESSDVNLFVSLGAKKHKSSGQPAGVEIQERPEDVTEKEKKALRVHVMEEDDISGSEELESSASSTMSNMQDERASAMFHEATHTALSLPPRLKMQSGLKTKMDTSEIKFSFSAVKPGELPDDREMYFSFEKNCLVKKPQEDDREEEQQAPQEAASQLTPGFRFSLQLQQKPTYVKLELGQSSSKGRTTQNKELDVHPQTVSTETTVGTSRCPTMDPLQGEVKQSTDRPTGRETADPVHPLTMLESLPVLTESTECHVPLGGSPEKSLDAQIAEEKQDLEGVLPEVALGSFHRHMPPLSNLKRKKIRKKIIGTTNVLSLKCVIMKVKKPPKCHRRRLRSNFKVMIKHILQDKTTAGTLLNVIGPHLSILPHVRMHSRLNVGNHSHTKLKQETSEAEREDDYSAITNKGSDSGNTLEAARLQGHVSGDQEASPEAVLEDRWNRRLNEDPEKELKSMKEMQQLMTFAEIMAESILMATTGSVHVENMEKSLTAPADLRCTADDSEMSPPTSEKSLIRDPLNHTRESDVPDDGSDTRETGYCFAEMKAERPKDLPAVFPKTFNCHMPILSHSKVKKTRVRSSRIECRVNSKSVPMKTLKPSISQMCNITGHQRKKLKSELKAKFEKISQANGLEYEYLNTLYSPVHSRLQGETKSFCHVQAKLRGLAIEERPLYVDLFDESNALCDREEKVQDTEEKEQKTLQITAPQHTQYLWINGCRGKETHLAKPDAGLHHLTQEQDTQHQTCFKRAALQTDVQMGPQEAEELLKTNKPEDDLTAPAGLEVLPPEAGNLSPVKLLNIPTECGVASGGNLTRELGSYSVDKNSEVPESLQVTFLQSSDSVDTFVSKSQRKKNTLKLARKQITVSRRYRAMREQIPSILRMLPGRQGEALQCNFKMKNLQKNKNTGDVCSPVILSRVPVLPNTKMSIRLNVERDTQRITRLDHTQMQEKSPNERKVCCPASINMSSLSNSVKDRKEGAGEQDLPIPESGQGFIFSTYQEQDHDLIKSDEGLKRTGSINIQIQPQTHFAESILSSASCPTLDPFQLKKLESDARFFPPMSGEAKFDEKIFSAREGGVPSEANHQKEQAGGTEKEEKMTLAFCMAALSLSKGKRNFKQYSDMKILMNPKCRILKAKKPPISYMLNIKGGARRNRRKKLGYNLTTKMGHVGQGTKIADSRDSLLNIIPAINRYSDREGEEDMLGEKRLSSEQVKQNISPHKGNVTPDDPKEGDLQDEESEQKMLLKVIPQYSQHFILCSDQTKELELHKPGNKGCGKTLFVTKQDIPQHTQPADPVQATQPKRSQQTQNGTVWSASSNFPLLKLKESLTSQVVTDTVKCGIPSDESHMGELDDHGKEEKSEFKKDLRAPVPESSATATPDPPEPKQGRKTFTCRALKSKMSPRCVVMKARKATMSQIFNIPGNGCLKTLPSKTLRSQIVEFLIEIKYARALGDVTAERKEGGARELLATMLEFWDAATLALPVSKRERNHSELRDKRNKMSPKCITLKAKKAPISKTFNVTKRGGPSRGRQLEGKFTTMRKQVQSLAATRLNATSSSVSVSLDRKVHNRKKAEMDVPGKTRFHPELQQQGHWPDGGKAWCPYPRAKRGNVRKEPQGHSGEAAPRNFQHLTFHAHHMKEPHFVKSDLKQKYSARGKIPESLTIAEELQQHTFFTQSVLRSVSSSILNSLPSEKAPKSTKTQRSRIFSPVTEKLLGESLAVKVPSDVLSETDPTKEPASSSPEGKKELQVDLQGRALQSLCISRPDSSEIKGLRNVALIPTSQTGEAQVASVLKTTNTASPSAPSRGKELVYTFDNMAKELSQSMSNTFTNTSFSPTPVSPATKTHKKLEAKKDPVKVSIIQLKPEDRKRLCKRWSALGTTSESRWQNEREGKEFVFKTGLQFLSRTENLLTISTTSVLSESRRQKKEVKFPERKDLTGPRCIMKAKRPLFSQVLNITEHGHQYCKKKQECYLKSVIKDRQQHESIADTFSSLTPVSTDNKIDIEIDSTPTTGTDQPRETRCNTKKQKPGFQKDKTEVEFSLKTICDSGSIPPKIQELMEAEREKGKPPRPKKSLNTRQIAFSQSLAKSAKSRNKKTLRQGIREQEENCQISSPDIFPQCRYRFMLRQQLKKSPTHVKYTVNLKREVHPDQPSPKRESCSTMCDISRVRLHTKHQHLTAPGVRGGDRDEAQPPMSAPQRTEVAEKTDVSLGSKRQNRCLPESDASQEKTCKEQDLLKEGSNSRTLVEPTLYSITETPHLENTIPNHLGRDGLRETDTFQGSKGQTFLCANAEVRQYTPAVEIRDVKPDPIPERLLDSASCPSRELIHVREAGNATGKESVSFPVVSGINLWETEMPKLTNLLLTSNEQKINCSEKGRTEQQNSSNQRKGNLLEFISSCILHQLHIERRKKEVSAKGMSSAVLSPVVQKASNAVDIPVDQPPCSGRKEHQQESTCKALPTSLSHSMMDIFQIKLPGVMKAAKEVDSPRHHNSNTEGIGLPVAESEEQPEWMSETLQKSTSHSQTGLHQTNISVQEVKFDDTSKMHSEYSTPQAKEALKGMDVIVGYTQKSEKGQNLPSVEQKQQHLLIPSENFPSLRIPSEFTSYPQNNPWLLPHLTPQTKEALSEVGNVFIRTKGLDLISKEQLNTQRECGLEWTVPSAPPTQMTRQNTRPPLESSSETAKYQNVSLLKGKKLSDGEQVIDSITNVSSLKLSVRKKVHLCKACRKKVQKELCLPGFFSHSLSIHMPPLPENKTQKNDLKQGVEKDIVHTQRTLEKLIFSNIFNTTDYGGPGNRPELQRKIKEEVINRKHRKVKPDLVVTDVYESIPSLKLNIKTADEIISNNLKRIKQLISQRKTRIKGANVKGTMDPNITLKAKKPSRSHMLSEKELSGQLNIVKEESEGQIGKGTSGVKLTNLFASVPSLSPLDLNSRTKGGRDMSRIAQNCLPPLKLQATSNIRKASFAESINRESLSNIIGSKHFSQKKREDEDNTVYVKDKRGCKRATFKRKKKLFKHTPHGNELQWNNKEQEKMMQEDESDGNVVLNKPHASIPSSSHLEQGPIVKEAASQTVSWFCPPSLTLQELSDAVITCKEPADDNLSNIARSKHMSQKNKNKVDLALKEIRHPQRMPLEVNQSPVAQELQLNTKEKEEKIKQDKGKQVGIQRQSCVSISSPPYSEVDTRREGEAVMLRKTKSCFLQPKLQESSDMGNIAYEKSVSGDISNSVKKAEEHAIQEEEEGINMEKVLLLKKKNSPLSQEVQLDVEEQKKKIQRIQGEPSVILICTSRPATSFNSNTGMIGADDRAKVTRYSCSGLPHQISDAVKKANRESTERGIISDVQAANEFIPQKGKDQGETANMNYMKYSKETSSKAKEFPLPHVSSSPGSHSPQARDEPANRRENLGHAQEKKCELDEVLTGLCLPQFTLNKGEKEKQGALTSCLPPLWRRKSLDAQELKYTVSPLSEISSDSKRTKYMTQEEKDKTNVFVRDPMHPDSLALKVRRSPLFHMLGAKKLQVSIKEQVRRKQKGRRDTVVILSKICPFVTSSTHLKSDTIKEDRGGPGVLSHSVPHLKIQASRPSVQRAPPKSTDRKKEKQYLPPKERDRAHTTVVSGSVHASGSDFKAKTSCPPHVFGTAEHDALSRRKEAQPSMEERTEQGQGRAGDPGVTPTETPPALPSASDRRLDAGIKEDRHLPEVTGFSPPFQLFESSGAGKIRYADFSQGISSCNITVRANGRVSYKETEIRVKRRDEKDRTHPQITAVEAHTSPLTHLLSRNRLPLNVKEQGKEVQDGSGMVLRETRASLPSPSYLRQDASRNEKKDTERITQSCFPPLKIYDPLNLNTKADVKSFDGHLLKNKARLKTDNEDRVLPTAVHQKAKELPLSHRCDAKESQCKIKKQKKMVQREDSELVTRLKNICTSLLTLPYLKFDKPEGERYMIRITKLPPPQAESKESSQYADTSEGDLSKDVNILKEHMLQKEEERKENVAMNSRVDPHNMDLKAKESPIVLAHNLTDLSIREEGMSMLPRSSFPPVNFQKSSSSEEAIHVESMARDTVISPSREKYLPRNKKEDRVERRNFVSPKHQGKEMQESKDEPGMVLTKPSTPSPSLPALKLDKEVQVDDETLAPHRRSVLGRISKAEQMIHTYSTSGDSRKGVQNEEQPISEKEERDREKSVDRRGVTHTKYIILKSKKSPSSYTLHRSELYLNLGGTGQKKQETQGKPPGKVGRNIYLATPPTKPKLDKGTQVDEGKLGIEKPSLLPRMISELSDATKRTDTKGISDDVIKRKQCMSEKEKKLDVKNVDMRLRTHHKKSAISPIPDVFSTKKFVLNVIQEPGGKVHKDKDEPSMVLTRTFLSIPSAPLYLDLGSKTDKDTLGITGSSHPQQNLQETSDTQKTAITESAAGEREIVKNAERSAPEETMQQWTANFVLSVQQRRGPLQVKSEGGVSQLLSDSQQEDFYVTGHGTVKGGKRLESFFAGSEAQQKKDKPETLATILSFPMMGLTKIESLKKETEIMNDLSHKISPHVLVSLPRKLSKEIYATLGSPVSSEGFSASKQDVHHQEGALAQASPASTDLCKLDKPEEDRQNNRKTSEMSPPKVLAPQIKEPLEEVNITESDALQNADQEIVMKKQVVLQAGSGQKTRVDSSLSLKIPLQHVKQRTSLEIDVHKQTTVCPGIQMLPGIQMGMTEFDAQRGKKEQALLVPDKEAHNLELPQKSVSSWASPLQSGDVGRKSEAGTGSTGNLKQKKLEVKEGILKIDTNIAVHLEEDKIEMYKHTTVNLKEETIKMDTSNTVNLNTASLRAEEPQTETQVITPMANRCPTEQNHKKEREVSSAKHNIQLQKMPQKHALDSFYAYIPLSPKLGGQKGRLTIADLKRELSPKYLNMKIQKHPILQILGNTGRGTPSNRKKLEYNFNKSKKIDLRRGDASEIFIRSLSISTVSPSQTKEPVKSWTNLESVKRTCISEFQKNSPNTSETMKRNSSSIVKEGNQNFANTVPQDSQPFMVDKQQMHKVPNIKSEANLSSEINKNLAPQTNKRVVPEKGNSGIIKEADVLMTKQEKAPKPIETPTGCLIMSEDPKEYRNQSEPVQDIAIQKVQRQETSLGTVPIQPQVKGSERNTVGYSPSAGIMIPLCEAIKNFLESQIKNMIQNRFFPKNLEKVKDNKPDDWNSQLFTRGLSTLSMTLHPELQPKPILENFTCKEKIKLRNHLESKAPEIRLNLIPEVVKRSFQRFSFYKKLAISKHNSWKLYPRHKQMFFSPLEGIDTVEFNLKHKYEKDSPPASCMKSLIVNVSRGSEEAVNITKLKRMKELESGVPSLTSAREKTLPHILQNCSVGEKNKLLIHFSKKTLEIQMKAFPRIVRESYTMANAQDRRKPLSKCVHSVVKVPKRKNRVLLLFEENSLHQIDLDLQYKYFRFLLGSPVAWMFPKPTAFPKHTLKLQTVAICEKGDNSGESGSHSIDTQPLEHIPFKKQSFHEDTSLVRNFLAPTQVCALDPDQHSMVQKDTMALSKLKSHVTPEKDKQCHVWFQETNTYESVDLKIQKKAQDVGGSHSIQNSEDFTDSQTDIENSDNLEECSAHDVHDSEDCIFLDATPYLSQEAESILFELQKGIPVENLYKKVKMGLKPLYSEDVGSHHIRGHRQHSSIVTPHSYEPHKSRTHGSRKRGWSSKMQPPDPWCHSSLNTVELPSVSSSISFNGEMLSQTTVSGNNYSLVPLTESNIKLHLAKSQGKPHRHSESRERRKAKLDFFRKNNMPWECDDSYTKSKQKHTRRKNVRDYESERLDYFPSKYKSSAKPHQEDISFHSEKKQNQPFFYACIPADSLEIIPQTIRWTVPPKTVRKRNFRVPLVAKISTSYSIWNSSKKLLGSLLESFSLLH
ncbi:unnamed protein product [Rangifer tarandus platyrhynchus]|uniref:Coiled-coil domain-containing protein n=1 Tax=Rangifer tarandus platyrhynchus TaxID=3082113 RepID=A0ABN9A0V0_RANTA|nr:unnamed protein product [Rangifer tarandus platyrhynchus]